MAGSVLILVAAFLWALIGVFTAQLFVEGMAPMEIAFWRALLAGGLFIGHGLLGRHLRLRRGGDALWFGLFGVFGVALFFSAFNFAIETGGISLAVVLLYTAPAFVALLAWLILGESLGPKKVGAVALVIAGVTLVAFGGGGSGVSVSAASLAWGLTAGLGYASFYIFGKFYLLHYHPVAIYAYVLPVAALAILPFVEFSPKSTTAWALIAVLTLLSTYLAYLVYYLGLRNIEASKASLLASTEPVMAATFAAIFFGERLGMWGIIGAAMVVAASLLVVRRRRRVKVD